MYCEAGLKKGKKDNRFEVSKYFPKKKKSTFTYVQIGRGN